MNVASLNVTAAESVLDELQSEFASFRVQRVKKGQKFSIGNKVHQESFIAIEIADCNGTEELLKEVSNFLLGINNVLNSLLRNANSVLRLGFTVGDSEQYTVSADIPSNLLAIMSACNISIEFSAYPTSDEANAI